MRAMKDSGIDWVGSIPNDWQVYRAKHLFRESTSKGNKRLVLLSATQDRGVVDKSTLEGVVQVAETTDLTSFKTVHVNDFVISLRSFQGGFELAHNEGVITPAYTVFRFIQPQQVGYYGYLFKSYGFISKINSLTVGIREGKNIQYADFADMLIPIPSKNEQERIADFLDSKCGEIDEMIALQEKTVEELKAYKQSVITEAVTKGLNPDAPMKDSGIPWIGLIPQGWSVKRFKNILRSKLQYGANESGLVFNPTLPRYVRITDILDNRLREDIDKQSLTNEQAKDYILEDKDILFARSGGTVGKSFIYRKEYGLCAYAGYLIRAKVDENNCSEFVYYYTLSSSYDNWKNSIFIQSTIQNIGGDKYSLMEIPCPPLTEQQAIASYLDKKCSEIDCLIEIKQQKAEELKTYKKSLIYEYVTGKKEVV